MLARSTPVRQLPVHVNAGTWVLVRGGAAVARVDTEVLGYREETFYKTQMRDGRLVGYFTTLEDADSAV